MSGYVDLQVNGYHGIDFNRDGLTDDEMREACRQLRRDGVQRFLPTVITDDFHAMCRRIARIADASRTNEIVAEMVAGIHVEGPFISSVPGYVGAHPVEQVCEPSVDLAMRLVESGDGLVRLFTLAPESPAAAGVIERLVKENIVVCAGHTDASLDQLRSAIDRGLTMFTHLGNGCPGQMHRHDNIIQRVLCLADRLVISLIADGHHVPFFAMANYLQCIPESNVVIVTDAITAAGLGPGKHALAGQIVEVDENLAAWAAGRKNFAGCATTMPQMMELMGQHLERTPEQIGRWTRANPLRVLGTEPT